MWTLICRKFIVYKWFFHFKEFYVTYSIDAIFKINFTPVLWILTCFINIHLWVQTTYIKTDNNYFSITRIILSCEVSTTQVLNRDDLRNNRYKLLYQPYNIDYSNSNDNMCKIRFWVNDTGKILFLQRTKLLLT